MAQALVTSLFAAMCLLCISGVLAEDCAPYLDANLRVVTSQTCVLSSCGGTCTQRFCIPFGQLDQTQIMCIVNNLYAVVATAIVFSLLLLCGIIGSCWKCCMLAHYTTSII